jgi:predicted O-methyltransferase YrrM
MSLCNLILQEKAGYQTLIMALDAKDDACILAIEQEFRPNDSAKQCIERLEKMISLLKLIND